jgi:hypothetical protein
MSMIVLDNPAMHPGFMPDRGRLELLAQLTVFVDAVERHYRPVTHPNPTECPVSTVFP